MALAIDALVQKAITMTTDLATMIPEVWAAELEPNLRKRAVLEQSLTVFSDLENAPGDTLHVPDLPDISAAVALTEGTDITVADLSDSAEVQLVPSEVGRGIGITRKTIDRLGYDGMAAIVERLAYAMSLYIEPTISGLWDDAVPTKGGTFTVQYPGGHDDTTIVAADTMSDAVVRHAVATMQATDVMPFDDGLYLLYMHPYQAEDYLQDDDVRTDIRYNSPAPLFRGEIGVHANCRIVLTTHLATATENSITAYKALLVSPRWAAVAYKRRPQIVVDPTLLDFGRRRQVAIVGDLKIASLHSDRALVLTTAV
jgi:N4-gp56 family major capsid protein